ncbi:MAG: M20/M25/M40 family metallo-hydrolase [Deltaproteobacteria bacterium]|nr:M20/M25/M40 family metallo-hydrolase [Deltaproteobacteria bacterium]
MKNPIQYLEENFDKFVQELCEYSRIPSISFEHYPPYTLDQSAEWTIRRLKSIGLENVQIFKIPGAHPYVYADWLHAPGRPTLLLYGHHDVQPPGRPELWSSPAFEPTLKEDGRLYGRGVADDKAGVMLHIAALEAYLKTQGTLPLNIRFIVEGEEETGSTHLKTFLNEYKKQLECDILVLTDTANIEEGLPSITYSLRGIVDCTVEVRTLKHPLHSGLWGGPAVDALTVLSKILARLVDDEGEIAIPGFYDDVPPLSEKEQMALKEIPFDEQKFRQDMAPVDSLEFGGEKDFSLLERMWIRPSLAILGIDSQDVDSSSNKIVESTRAKISIRVVAGQDPERVLSLLSNFLTTNVPFGASVMVSPGVANPGWKMDPRGKAFEAAARALEKGFACKTAVIGCGASIPFVKPISEVFGNIPALLIGIEDPKTNAHGENESLSLSDFKKGMKAAVYLYEELAL